MNTMTYKGYIGSVAFSEKDNVFFGKIEGINGLVNFERRRHRTAQKLFRIVEHTPIARNA